MNDLLTLVAHHGIALVFVVTLASRIGAPVPAAPFVVVAGGLSAMGVVSLWALLASAVAANVIGDGVWYLAGKRYGYKVLRLLCRVSMSPDSCVRQSESFMGKWGGSSLIAAKFVPGVSVIAAPMAGALGMPRHVFLAFALLAALVWSLGFALLGLVFSADIGRVLDLLSGLGMAAGIGLLVLIAGYVVYRYVRRQLFLRGVATALLSVAEVEALLRDGPVPLVVDVSSALAIASDPRRVPGAIAVELKDISRRAPELALHPQVILYCDCPDDASAAQAARLLALAGYPHGKLLHGGLSAWVASGARLDTHAPLDLVVAPRESIAAAG